MNYSIKRLLSFWRNYSTPEHLVIAVDGPAASGKGTLSRRLAAHFGLRYLDTGSLYRAVALVALDECLDLADEDAIAQLASGLDESLLEDERLREPGVGEAASKIASLSAVRAALLSYQRKFAEQRPGAVLDGRDIGTIVCPDADVKLFVTASTDVRAERRFNELIAAGKAVTLAEIRDEIERRDARDASRSAAPLTQSIDAHLLDTTNLDIEAAMNAAVSLINKTISEKK